MISPLAALSLVPVCYVRAAPLAASACSQPAGAAPAPAQTTTRSHPARESDRGLSAPLGRWTLWRCARL